MACSEGSALEREALGRKLRAWNYWLAMTACIHYAGQTKPECVERFPHDGDLRALSDVSILLC